MKRTDRGEMVSGMHRLSLLLALSLAVTCWQGCTSAFSRGAPPAPTPADPSFRFRDEKLKALDSTIETAISDRRLPGAVLWVEHKGAVYRKTYGERALEPAAEPMTEDTIFDAASLTKVMATTPAIMLLVERGKLDLNAPVQKYIEEFRRGGKDEITVRHLLTHTSGLRAGLSPRPDGARSAIAMACNEVVTNPVGTTFLYSDINFILLGEIVERVSGHPLEKFVGDEIYRPLKMRDTRYLPLSTDKARIAPTEREGTNMLRGVVHDPTARRMGGVAGHAGVFTTAADTARFARMMVNQGALDGVRIFRPETVASMIAVQSPAAVGTRRGFGWDIDSGYARRGEVFPMGSYGHTGFTGTAMWIDPFSKTFWILMSNRVHPDGKGDIRSLQRTVSTLAAEAAGIERTQPAAKTQ
jgi:CubicO group peptidase (beta-lactamase class C family)